MSVSVTLQLRPLTDIFRSFGCSVNKRKIYQNLKKSANACVVKLNHNLLFSFSVFYIFLWKKSSDFCQKDSSSIVSPTINKQFPEQNDHFI